MVVKVTAGKFDPLGVEVSGPLKEMVTQLLHLNENRRPDLKGNRLFEIEMAVLDILVDPLILPHALRICLDLGVIQPEDDGQQSGSSPGISDSATTSNVKTKVNGVRSVNVGSSGGK